MHRRVRLEQLLAHAVDADEPVVGDAPDERRVAAPAVRVAVLVHVGRDEEAGLAEAAHDLVGGLHRREAVQPAVVVVEPARLVDRRQHRQAERPAELEVLAAAAGRDMDDAGALLERDLVPGDDLVLDRRAGAEVVERPAIAEPDELLAAHTLLEALVRVARDGDPLAVLAQPVLRIGMHGGGDVGRQRPRRRRPDDDRFPWFVE